MTTTTTATAEIIDSSSIMSFREEIALEIRTHLDNIGASYLKVGKALNEAREDFDKQQDFLVWVSAEFGIQKAQCYKLMKVGKSFGDDSRFAGVAMRVLAVLANFVEDEAVMNRAAELAKAGNLDSTSLEAILAPATKPTPATPPARNMAANDGNTQEGTENGATPTASTGNAMPTIEEVTPPEVIIDGEPVESSAPAAPVVPASIVDTATNERERGLLAMVETLRETIKQMQEEQRRHATERDSRVKAAPMLPQFKSKCMYARLGLSLEEAQDAKKVKKAQRDLVKLGYGEGHEAWANISEAVTSLLSA